MNNETAKGADGVRLAKHLAAQVPCSRGEAERYITGGWVRVDDHTEEEPMARVLPGQVVTLDAGARPEPLRPATVLWHQPADAACPSSASPRQVADFLQTLLVPERRWTGDRSRERLLKAHGRQQALAAGLDAGAEGLVVFSQDPGVLRTLADRARPQEHEWLVQVRDASDLDDASRRQAVLASLAQPVQFDGQSLPVARASWQSERRLRLAIKGTLPGQVGFLLERAGLVPVTVRRQRVGRVGLGALPAGQWCYLAAHERF